MKNLFVNTRDFFNQVYIQEAAVYLLSILGLSLGVSWVIEIIAKELFRLSLV
jgi:ABC-type nitrate/sulfonate/bicarbonate transport system permease component